MTFDNSDAIDNIEIYLDLESNEFSEIAASFVKEGVREETHKIVNKSPVKGDVRPRVWCYRTGRSFLVDTGAAVSVVPRGWADGELQPDPDVQLKAVNGSNLPTYGKKKLKSDTTKKCSSIHFIWHLFYLIMPK